MCGKLLIASLHDSVSSSSFPSPSSFSLKADGPSLSSGATDDDTHITSTSVTSQSQDGALSNTDDDLSSSKVALSSEQAEILSLVKQGESIFFTGSAGA